jgi:PAS domain S-box-containing protein
MTTQNSSKAESQTNDNFDLLQDFVDNTSDIILMLSLVGEFMFVNNAFLDLLDYSRAEIKEISIDDILHPQYIESIKSDFEKIKNGEHVSDFLLVIRNKQKKRIYLSGDINCRYVKGEPVSFRCILKDITQRRRAEAAQNLYYAIAQSNLNTKSLEGFLMQVHQNLQKNIYANNFFVAVYEPENNSIYFPYHVDEYYETGQNYLKRKLGNGLIEYSILQNKPLIFTFCML